MGLWSGVVGACLNKIYNKTIWENFLVTKFAHVTMALQLVHVTMAPTFALAPLVSLLRVGLPIILPPKI